MDAKRKKLVFHFYTFPNFKENEAIQIHLKCLKHYHSIFTDAVFVIALNDVNNHTLIHDTQEAILDCGFENVKFIIKKNTEFREAITFYDEIVAKMKEQDCYIFFGHTKGVTNFEKYPDATESIRQWIYALYYLSLNFVDEAEHYMSAFDAPFFGSLVYLIEGSPISEGEALCTKMLGINGTEKNFQGFYAGTFFFINPASIIMRKARFGINYDLPLSGLSFAESYPCLVTTWQRGYTLCSHLSRAMFEYDFYRKMPIILKSVLTQKEYKEFLSFINNNE